jgi:hypothetical protein
MTAEDLLTALYSSSVGDDWPPPDPSLSPIPLSFAQWNRLRNRGSQSPFPSDIIAAVEPWKMAHGFARREGAISRLHKDICNTVAKVLSVTELELVFGDFQATAHTNSDVPDFVILALPRLNVLAVGFLKTFWTVEQEKYPVNESAAD